MAAREHRQRLPTLGCTFALALGLGAWVQSARASSEIPAECGSLAQFTEQLQHRLGHALPSETVNVHLTPELSGYRLLVEVGAEQRELHDQDCRELMRAAVVVALALLEPAPPAPLPLPAPLEAEAKTPAPLLTSAATGERQMAVAAGAGLQFGMLPQPSLLLELDAQLKWSSLGLAAGVRYMAPSSGEDESARGARVGGVGAYAAALLEPWPKIQGRLGFDVYRLSGKGTGNVVEPLNGAAWALGPSAGLSFVPFARPPFWTSLGIEAQLNLIRPHFDVLPHGQVFRVPLFAGATFARAGLIW